MSDIREGLRIVIEDIVNRKGGCETTDLLNAARDPGSPAHAAFEWDDSKAAEGFRLAQARRYLKIIVISIDKKPPERLYFVPRSRHDDDEAPGAKPGIYRPISAILKAPDEWERALAASIRFLESAHKSLTELVDHASAKGIQKNKLDAIKMAEISIFDARVSLYKTKTPNGDGYLPKDLQ